MILHMRQSIVQSTIVLAMVALSSGVTQGKDDAKPQRSADTARQWILDALERAPALDRPRRGYWQIAAMLEHYPAPAALDELEEILTQRWDTWPNDARDALRGTLAAAWIKLGNIERARQLANDAPKALRALAHYHIQKDEYQAALRLAERMESKENRWGIYRWITRRHAENGRRDAAMDVAAEAPTAKIRDGLHSLIARAFADRGDAEAARDAIRRIEETRSADKARRTAAVALAAGGQEEEAIALAEGIEEQRLRRNAREDVREALDPEPERPDRVDRPTVRKHLKAGNLDEAIDLARSHDSTDQQGSRLETIARHLIEVNRFGRAERMIEATEFPPNRFALYNYLAEMYRRAGRAKDAPRIVQRMAQLRPELAEETERGGMKALFIHASADAILAYHHGQLGDEDAFREHGRETLKTAQQIDAFPSVMTYGWLTIAFMAHDRMDLLREWVGQVESPRHRFRATILIFRALSEFEGESMDEILDGAL